MAGPARRPTRRTSRACSAGIKRDWPHLCHLADTADLARELDAVCHQYNKVRLHAGIGYVTPDDEHEGRGPAIRRARREGLHRARAARIAARRHPQQELGV